MQAATAEQHLSIPTALICIKVSKIECNEFKLANQLPILPIITHWMQACNQKTTWCICRVKKKDGRRLKSSHFLWEHRWGACPSNNELEFLLHLS